MKTSKLLLIAIFALAAFTGHTWAETVTEGRLDIQKLAAKISADVGDYSQKRDLLVEDIRSVQKGIEKLNKDFASSETNREKTLIQSRTLAETGRLLSLYGEFYRLNIEKVESILPELEKMRSAVGRGEAAKAARTLNDPDVRKRMETLYCTLASMGMKFQDGAVKKEIAGLLRENELLYKQTRSGVSAFDDIVKNIDKVSEYLKSVYAKTVLRSRILDEKKSRTEMAIDLMGYALALRPIQESMIMEKIEGVMEVPEVDISEFVDPIIQANSGSEERETMSYQNPEVDSLLKGYQNGPNFLK